MSKKQYTEAFSNIHPSDEVIERIMNMTEKKHFTNFGKVLAVSVAIISIFLSMGLVVANAATDGAVSEAVSEAFENVSNKITILINGNETQANVSVTEKTNVNGEQYIEAEIEVDVPDSDDTVEYKARINGDFEAENIDSALQEGFEWNINNEQSE